MADDKPPIPAFPGGPDPSKPVPDTPVEGLDLETYAYVSARIAEKKEPQDAILAEIGLTNRQWMRVEQTWLLRVAVAGLQGDTVYLKRYDDACVAGQERVAQDQPIWPMEQFAVVVAQIEAGYPPPLVLAQAGLTMAGFAKMQRVWAQELAKDPDASRAFRGHVEGWKARYPKPS